MEEALPWACGGTAPSASPRAESSAHPAASQAEGKHAAPPKVLWELGTAGRAVTPVPGTLLASFTSSMVMSADHPGLTFSLRLIRSEPTFSQPAQQWSFVSDFAVSGHGRC